MCLSRQNTSFVATKYACRNKTFVATERDKHTFVATKVVFCRDRHVFCRDKHVFVATKLLSRQNFFLLVAAPANDSFDALGAVFGVSLGLTISYSSTIVIHYHDHRAVTELVEGQ